MEQRLLPCCRQGGGRESRREKRRLGLLKGAVGHPPRWRHTPWGTSLPEQQDGEPSDFSLAQREVHSLRLARPPHCCRPKALHSLSLHRPELRIYLLTTSIECRRSKDIRPGGNCASCSAPAATRCRLLFPPARGSCAGPGFRDQLQASRSPPLRCSTRAAACQALPCRLGFRLGGTPYRSAPTTHSNAFRAPSGNRRDAGQECLDR